MRHRRLERSGGAPPAPPIAGSGLGGPRTSPPTRSTPRTRQHHLRWLRHDEEDCLYLNVWTGATDPTERRPVKVWLHHGAYRHGGPGIAIYDGANLARHGLVVVSVAYRLGRIGFLAHPGLSAETPDGVSGNYGILDQIAAL